MLWMDPCLHQCFLSNTWDSALCFFFCVFAWKFQSLLKLWTYIGLHVIYKLK